VNGISSISILIRTTHAKQSKGYQSKNGNSGGYRYSIEKIQRIADFTERRL
ncbi:unnamed protein product, partial [Acidithrix sp. C25]